MGDVGAAVLALADVEPLRRIVAHVAGLVVQDAEGYSRVHLAVIEDARAVLARYEEAVQGG